MIFIPIVMHILFIFSREDLLNGSAGSENDSLFVALYDFHGVGEEQLSLKRGQYDLYLR